MKVLLAFLGAAIFVFASHAAEVGDDGLHAVALALDLGLEPGHLVPVELILDVPVDVESHLDAVKIAFFFSMETQNSSLSSCCGGYFLFFSKPLAFS